LQNTLRTLFTLCLSPHLQAGAEYESVEYDVKPKAQGWDTSEWFNTKPELLKRNALMNLPYVEDGDVIVTQSNACLMYLGRKLGLAGKNEAELTIVEQCLCQIMDLRNATVAMAYGKGDVPEHLKASVTHFDKLESFLGQQGTLFLTGANPTVADFHLWEMCDQHNHMASYVGDLTKSPLKRCPKIAALYGALQADPKLKSYFSSTQHALPQNNKMAKYGGTTDDGRIPK